MLVCLATRKGGKGLKKSAAYPPEYGQKVASTHRKYIDPPLHSQEMVFTMIPLVERVSETITEKIYAYWQNNETSARQLSRCGFFGGVIANVLSICIVLLTIHTCIQVVKKSIVAGLQPSTCLCLTFPGEQSEATAEGGQRSNGYA